jgi:hypothetical protein
MISLRDKMLFIGEDKHMRLKMNLLENAYDFINSSLFYYSHSEEDGRNWKIAFINMVQAIEILGKEKLRQSNKMFVYENIDNPKNTISLSVALDRMLNILELPLDDKDVSTVRKAIQIRNQMMHYEIDLHTHELKAKYSVLFEFATSFHFRFLDGELHDHIHEYLWETEAELMEFFKAKFITYYSEEVYNAFPKEMLEAQYIVEYIIGDEDFPRIKYGNEKYNGVRHTMERCGDCLIKLGEYHVPGCDWEQCPKCLGQAIGCDCEQNEESEHE